MKDSILTSGWFAIVILILSVIIVLAAPFAWKMGEGAADSLDKINAIAEKKLENIKEESVFGKPKYYTYYTEENIKALGSKAVTVGYTNQLNVVGLYSDDFSEVILSRNGDSSDGVMIAEAFYNNLNLKSAVLRYGLRNVPNNAFEGCVNLESVYLSDMISYIGYNAFSNTGIASIYIPKSVTTICSGAFANCSNLKTIIFEAKEAPSGFYESDYPEITFVYRGKR